MDISALDKALAILESRISGVERYVDSLEKWLWISSLAVIVGVALEVYFVIHEYKEDRETWLKGIVRPPDKPSTRVLCGEIASIVLVVLGIAGELGVGILSSNANANLRTLNNSRLDLVRQQAIEATTQAGDAKRSAKESARAASSAVSSARAAKQEAEGSMQLARGARQEADSFEKRIVSATDTATKAESNLVEAMERARRIEAQLEWRLLTTEQQEKLRAALLPLSGTALQILFTGADPEPGEYAAELANAIQLAGWKVTLGEILDATAPRGLWIRVRNVHSVPGAALQRAFIAAGVPVSAEVTVDIPPGVEFAIMVGLKPKPSRPASK